MALKASQLGAVGNGGDSSYVATRAAMERLAAVNRQRALEGLQPLSGDGFGSLRVGNRSSMSPGAPNYTKARSLSGHEALGLVNVAYCTPFENAIDTLGTALERVESAGLTGNKIYQQAKSVYDDETSYDIFNRTKVWLGNCDGQTARIGGLVNAVNDLLSRSGSQPVVVPPQVKNTTTQESTPPPPSKPFDLSDLTTPITIGAIAVGVIAVAYMFGPLVRALGSRAAPQRQLAGWRR